MGNLYFLMSQLKKYLCIVVSSENQPVCERYLQWSCSDECKYNCMWKTVDAFHRDGLNVPQFYGKVSVLCKFRG